MPSSIGATLHFPCSGPLDGSQQVLLELRHFEDSETYDVMQATLKRYSLRCEVYAPDAGELARLIETDGPNLFYESVEKRKSLTLRGICWTPSLFAAAQPSSATAADRPKMAAGS